MPVDDDGDDADDDDNDDGDAPDDDRPPPTLANIGTDEELPFNINNDDGVKALVSR